MARGVIPFTATAGDRYRTMMTAMEQRAANTAAQAQLNMSQPGIQPGNIANSESGTYFLPWQEQVGQQYATTLMGMLDKYGNLMDRFGGNMGALGGGGDFNQYMQSVMGAVPQTNFSDIPIEDVMTPGMLNEQMNNLFAGAQSGAGASAMNLFSARPGMATGEERAGYNASLLDAATRAGIAREYANKIPSLMFQNQDQRQRAMGMQTNVEASRLNQNLQMAGIGAGLRGQDIEREGGLLRALSSFGSGAGGLGGFLSPLSYSTSSSQSGPAGYLFDPADYRPPAKESGGSAFYSDRRLKSNIRRIGTLPCGLAWYSYTIFGRREQGVMAQEVLDVIPEAVGVANGFYFVDYSMVIQME